TSASARWNGCGVGSLTCNCRPCAANRVTEQWNRRGNSRVPMRTAILMVRYRARAALLNDSRQPPGEPVHERRYGTPILGRSPRHAHVWIAAGHGMLGISMSSGSGQLMTDLITGRAPVIDPAPYRAERFQ